MPKSGSLFAFTCSVFAALLLTGCVASGQPDYPLACMAEVNPPGSYGYPAGVAVPVLVPEAGGTQAGADAVNACIKAKAAAGGKHPAPAKAPQPAAIKALPANASGSTKTAATVTPQPTGKSMPNPQASAAQPNPQTCSYVMVGGDGYICALPRRGN